MSTTTKPLSPKALENKDGSFVLSSQDIQGLLRFCWTGALLSTTEAEYKKTLGLNDDGLKRMKAVQGVDIPALLAAYSEVKKHTTYFKDTTYPTIVSLASDVYGYAAKAGGKPSGSYYANIILAAQKIEAENAKDNPDQTVIDKQTKIANDLIKAEVAAIDKLTGRATTLVQALTTFQNQCIADQKAINAQESNLTNALAGENGRITQLRAQVKSQMDQIAKDEKAWEEDTIIAATAVSYAWVVPFGTIAAAVVIGVYSDKAVKLRKEINALWDLIAGEKSELDTDIAAFADITNASKQLKDLSDQLTPAITTIQKMMGAWGAIRDDLNLISANVNGSGDSTWSETITSINVDGILDEWNTLKGRVDVFRQTAYVSTPPQVKTIADVKSVIAKQPK